MDEVGEDVDRAFTEQVLAVEVAARSPGHDHRRPGEVRFPSHLLHESRGRPCEIAHVKSPDAQKVVKGCFWLGNALDFRLPLDAFPASIDVTKPMWVSGFQTCCSDPERNKFLDEIDKAQEVWRITGEAEATKPSK